MDFTGIFCYWGVFFSCSSCAPHARRRRKPSMSISSISFMRQPFFISSLPDADLPCVRLKKTSMGKLSQLLLLCNASRMPDCFGTARQDRFYRRPSGNVSAKNVALQGATKRISGIARNVWGKNSPDIGRPVGEDFHRCRAFRIVRFIRFGCGKAAWHSAIFPTSFSPPHAFFVFGFVVSYESGD